MKSGRPNEIATGVSIGDEILKAIGIEGECVRRVEVRVGKDVVVDVTRYESPFGEKLVVDHYKVCDAGVAYAVIYALGLAGSRTCDLRIVIDATNIVQVFVTREIDNEQGWALAKAIEGRCQLVPKDEKEGAPA